MITILIEREESGDTVDDEQTRFSAAAILGNILRPRLTGTPNVTVTTFLLPALAGSASVPKNAGASRENTEEVIVEIGEIQRGSSTYGVPLFLWWRGQRLEGPLQSGRVTSISTPLLPGDGSGITRPSGTRVAVIGNTVLYHN